MNSTDPYNLLVEHFNKHQYKRGAYLGSAPLDPSRRWAIGRRVTTSPECARVVCHKTPILTVYPDGTITLTTNGWHTNYTRDTLNLGLSLLRVAVRVHSRRLFGLSQWCIAHYRTRLPDPPSYTTYAFYDNLTLSPDTHQPINPRPFNARRIDTTQSRPFATSSREFFQTLPLLYDATPTPSRHEAAQAYYTNRLYDPTTLRRALTSQPELWPAVATWLAYETSSLPEAKRKLSAMVRADMYHTVPTDVTTV
jgi:hypothetical protein